MAQLSIQGVRKSYGNLAILHDVNIEVHDGEFVVLVGPSGCGKSTLLRMIAGLEDIRQGTISIGGRVVNDLAPKDRDISMVFQNYALYPHMTVFQNMAFSLTLARAPASEKESKVAYAASILGLESLLHRYPRELSGGQRQRVAMGRAIVRNPQVFLFDEPLSNLDAKLRVAMRAEIKGLHRRLGTTTVYVTHDQVEAMTMADRIVVMQNGNVEQIGTPLELYNAPVNSFVAQFIGSPAMNVLRVERAHDGAVTANGMPLGLKVAPLVAEGRDILLGKRPEHMVLADAGVPATVKMVEPTGSETHVTVEIAGQQVVCLLRGYHDLAEGQRINLDLSAGHNHFFDAQSGLRLPEVPAS